MGYATTRSLERVAAAMGALQAAPVVFEPAREIPQGGVLLALPALLAVGLLRARLAGVVDSPLSPPAERSRWRR